MTASPARRRPRRRRPVLRASLLLFAAAVVFVLGMGLGRALEEGREPGGTRTFVRTLDPLPLPPARETVTVTVSAPSLRSRD